MKHTVVLGSGVVGMSIAWELVRRGQRVTVVDRSQPGRQASWAGAGILAPSNEHTAIHPLDQLTAVSNRLHGEWSAELKAETSIDNGYQVCGGIYLARSLGEQAALAGLTGYWKECQIEFRSLSSAELAGHYPQLVTDGIRMALWVPSEAQIQNPHHLKALKAGCEKRGVEFVLVKEDCVFETVGDSVVGVQLGTRQIRADSFCIAAGAWTSQLLQPLGIQLSMIPVRGQMLLYKLNEIGTTAIFNEGSRYIVPRRDGHVLVGSSTEEAGFSSTTTPQVLRELEAFSESLIPQLKRERLVGSWAGLRPATYDGFPYLGRLPGLANGFVATGHFKIGLQQSTGTAQILADLVEGQSPVIDIAPFEPARVKEELP